MRAHTSTLVVVMLLLAFLQACGRGPAPTQSNEARATGLAQTAAALLTATAAASVTPVPPTATATETATAEPTATSTLTTTPPIDTPTPQVEAAPCIDNATFVTDVTVPDRTQFAPGTAFVKTWRIRNSGECAWSTDYQFRLISGSAMGAVPVNLTSAVPPGANVDISVSLVAPTGSGTYVGRFQLFTPAGEAFGTKPYVEIIVP
jgi:hypothetical protein